MGTVIFIIIVIIIIVWSIHNAKKTRQNWRQFAERNHLKYFCEGRFEHPCIKGCYKGVSLVIHIEEHGSGRSRHNYTRYDAYFEAALPVGIQITAEGFGDKIIKFFGGMDIKVGIRHVDDALRIKGSDEAEVRQFLQNEAIHGAVMKFITNYSGGTISDSAATIIESGYASNGEILQIRTDAAVNAVCEIEKAMGYQRPGELKKSIAEQDIMKADHSVAAPEGQDGTPEKSLSGEVPGLTLAEECIEVSRIVDFEPVETISQNSSTDTGIDKMASDQGSTRENNLSGGAPPAAVDINTELSRLRNRSTSFLERPEIIKRIKGLHMTGSMTVSQVSWTSNLYLSERVRGGHTAIGTMPDRLNVSVSFVKERDAEIKALKRGNELQFSGTVAHWDDMHNCLLLEAE